MKLHPTAFPFPHIDKLELSHSSRAAFHSCARKLEFRKIYDHSRRGEGLASGAGQALHVASQNWLQYGDKNQAIWHLVRNYPIKFQKSWMDTNSLAGCYQTLRSMMKWEKLKEYEIAKIHKPDGTLANAVEVPFILRIKEYPFYPDGRTIQVDYVGFIDFIFYHLMEDEYIVCDLKTTTKNTDKTVEFRFADQCLPYGLVLESLLGHDINNGFQVNYWSTLIDHVEPKNVMIPFHKTKADIQDWMQGYLFDLDRIRRMYNVGWFPRDGNSCMSWSRPCVFFDFCETRDPKVIDAMLQADEANQKKFEREDPWIIVDLDYEEAAA